VAIFTYTRAKYLLASGALNLATADLRLLLCMSDSTADADEDAATVGSIGLLDEYNGANYVAGGQALSGEVLSQEDANDRATLDAQDVTFASLGAGTRQCKGALLYAFNATVGGSVPVAWLDGPGFPFQGTGVNLLMILPAAGLLHVE
jgi:hypothetical protein